MTEYEIGDWLVYLQTGQLVEIVDKKPHFIGKYQYRLKVVRFDMDEKRGSKWINYKKLSKLCATPEMAQILYNINVDEQLKHINKQLNKGIINYETNQYIPKSNPNSKYCKSCQQYRKRCICGYNS